MIFGTCHNYSSTRELASAFWVLFAQGSKRAYLCPTLPFGTAILQCTFFRPDVQFRLMFQFPLAMAGPIVHIQGSGPACSTLRLRTLFFPGVPIFQCLASEESFWVVNTKVEYPQNQALGLLLGAKRYAGCRHMHNTLSSISTSCI